MSLSQSFRKLTHFKRLYPLVFLKFFIKPDQGQHKNVRTGSVDCYSGAIVFALIRQNTDSKCYGNIGSKWLTIISNYCQKITSMGSSLRT